MNTPTRVQRTRPHTKGQLGMPPGSKYVGRGSRWGNPFTVGARYVSRTVFHDAPFPAASDKPLGTVEHPAWSPWPAWTETVAEVRDRAHAVDLFRDHIAYNNDVWDPDEIRAELAGRDLACWCPLPEPGQPDLCHAAVLIALANDHGAPAGAGVCDRCWEWDAKPETYRRCPRCGDEWTRTLPSPAA